MKKILIIIAILALIVAGAAFLLPDSHQHEVSSECIQEKKDEIIISYTGNGFLQNMIRIMTGTLIEVGNGTKQVSEIPGILEGKNREMAGFTVPPEGLMLKQVDYAAMVSN